MQERHAEIEALGAGSLGVSVAADFQARWLRDERGIDFPLLVDADNALKSALEFTPLPLWRLLLPTMWWRYLKGWRRSRQGAITAPPSETPGVVIVDTEGRIRYRHEGRTIGDYPDVDEVIAALGAIG